MKNFKNLSLDDYLRMFWRRRWYFLITSFLVTGAITLYAWNLPHFYISEAKIMVESSFIPEDLVRPIVRTTVDDRINAIREQFSSRSFLERMIIDFRLYGYGTTKGFIMKNALEAMRGNIQIVNESRNTLTISYTDQDPHFAQTMVKRLVDGLIQANVNSRQTKAVVTDQFIDEQRRQVERDLATQEEKIRAFKSTHMGELPDQLAANMTMLQTLQNQLAASETALQQAQEQNRSLEYRLQELNRLKVLSRSLPPANKIQALPQAPVAQPPERSISPLEAQLAAKRAQLLELSAKYTPDHPDVVNLTREIRDLERRNALAASTSPRDAGTPAPSIAGNPAPPREPDKSAALPASATSGLELDFSVDAAEIRSEAERLRNEIARREKEKALISGQIKAIHDRLNLAPALEQEYMALTRDQESLKQQYRALQDKKFQSEMATSIETNRKNDSFKIVDEPNLPEKPAFPNRKQIAFIGLGAGILFGFGAVFVREYLDPTLETEQEAALVLRLPILISIPETPAAKIKGAKERNRRTLTA